MVQVFLIKALIITSIFSWHFSSTLALNRDRGVPSLVMDTSFSVNNGADIWVTLDEAFKGKGELAQEPVILDERMMGFSGACVREVECRWKGVDASLPNKIFIKSIVLDPPKNANEDALYKWRRNRLSYINEITFLADYAPTLRENEVKVPETYKILHQGIPEGKGGSVESFLFISESMSRPATLQVVEFEDAQFKSALRWLAGLHACYQGKMPLEATSTDGTDGGREDVWREGSHLSLSKRPASELIKLPENWAAFCNAFGWPEMSDLGTRVAAIAPRIAALLSPLEGDLVNGGKECLPRVEFSLVHGDAKPANLFFSEEGQKGVQTYAIDFQWTGWGVPATDIIYLIATGLSDSHINALDIDKDVLRVYHDALTEELDKRGVPPEQQTTYEVLSYHFKLATIDYVRWIMACRLPGDTPAKFSKRREEMDPNLGSYRRSEAMMIWLLSRVQAFLPEVEERLM